MGVRALFLIVALLFGGCAGLEQFPKTSKDYSTALKELDPDYDAILAQIYGGGKTAEEQKQLRNEFIERRMAVIDAHFQEFETQLVKQSVGVDFGVALAGVGVGAAGSFVAETASQILSAVSGGLAGAQAAYNKSALYDQASSALLAQMQASRKAIAAQIFQQWGLSMEDYPLWRARRDIEAYYFAGSLPGAVLATAADAKVKEQQAEAILFQQITPASATQAMFQARASLERSVDNLQAAQAKSLVTRIESEFSDAKPFIEAQYPADVREADTTGSDAKTLLKRLIVLTVRDQADAAKWRQAIANP